MNFDPTSIIPDYPSAALEKILDLGDWNSAPTVPGPAAPPPSQPATGGGSGGLMMAAGIAGLAVLVTVVVVAKKRGKR